MRPELIMKYGYRWSGGLQLDQARRLNELEQEKATLKRLVSELSLENVVLKDIAAEQSCQH
jgi:putative transposase